MPAENDTTDDGLECSNRILLMERNAEDRSAMRNVIERVAPGFEILDVEAERDAQARLNETQISLFVVDVSLPSGDGLDFLADVRMTRPETALIAVSRSESPNWKTTAHGAGADICVSKPLAEDQFASALSRSLGLRTEQTAFEVSLSDIQLVDLVQLKCQNGETATFEISCGERFGQIYIDEGEIVHCNVGEATGVAAFREIINWSGGVFNEIEADKTPSRTIHMNWQDLCLGGLNAVG